MWKEDPNLLAKKILERIVDSEGEISYTDLEKIAIKKDIDLNIFDTALTKLHRFKKVTQRTKGEEIYYRAAKRKKAPPQPPQPLPWTAELQAEADRCCGEGVAIPFYNPATDGPSPMYGPAHTKFLRDKMEREKEERQKKYWSIRNANKKNEYARK